MSRVPRHLCALGSLDPGQLYHVTNRGVNRSDIFHSDLDRIVFLSLFAEACQVFGTICHAFCLMDTHFHLVVEDPRGVLSQMMHRLGFCYARYFNDSRRERRSGPLFESRFRAKLIDSTAYFQDATSYVFLNPVRTKSPLSSSPDAYRWSSAALVCSETTPASFCETLMAPMGGLAGILSILPSSRFKACRERQRRRLEALVSGDWLERDRVLSGRSAKDYLRMLLARLSATDVSDPSDAAPLRHVAERPSFAGLDLDEIRSTVERTCRKVLPDVLFASSGARLVDVVAYTMWRFSSASVDSIALAARTARTDFGDVLREIHGTRSIDPAWRRLLWSLEWALRWQLRAAPHRPCAPPLLV